jgi:hypothetical protein
MSSGHGGRGLDQWRPFLERSEDQSPHAWCVGAERGCWRGTRHLCCRSRRAYTVTEAPGVPAAAGATRWPRPHRWRRRGTRPPHWSGRRRSAAWRTRTPGCLPETPRSLKSSGGCLDNRPSQRQCRRRGRWSANGVGVRSLVCSEGSAGCAYGRQMRP